MMEMLQFLQRNSSARTRKRKTSKTPYWPFTSKQVQPPDACLRNGEERRRTRRRSVPCLQQRRNYLLQILESSQIDMDDPEKKEMFEKGTHFNPVDLVCAVRDYKGHKFDW